MAVESRNQLINLIKQQIQTVVNNYPSEVDYNFILTENLSKQETNLKGNEVFIVYTLGQGAMSYNQVLQPVVFNVVCNQNYVKEVVAILNLYVETYNLNKQSISYTVGQTTKTNYVIQSYTTPALSRRFDEFESNYSTVCYFNGSFLISPSITPITKITIDNVEIPFISANLSYTNASDAKVIPNTYNSYTQTINEYGTVTLGLQTYFNTGVNIMSDCIAMANTTSSISQDKTFTVGIYINNSATATLTYTMRVNSFAIPQSQDEIPTFSVSLTM